METSLESATAALQTSIDDLNALFGSNRTTTPHEHLRLTSDTPLTLNAVTPFPQSLQSSVGREVSLFSVKADMIT